MKAIVTYKLRKGSDEFKTMEIENVVKVAKEFVTIEGKVYEETRFYDNDWHCRCFASDGIINIFLTC